MITDVFSFIPGLGSTEEIHEAGEGAHLDTQSEADQGHAAQTRARCAERIHRRTEVVERLVSWRHLPRRVFVQLEVSEREPRPDGTVIDVKLCTWLLTAL